MKRSELREHLFLMLFCKDFHPKEELSEQAQLYLETADQFKIDEIAKHELKMPSEKEKEALNSRFLDVVDKMDAIDEKIVEASVGWKINRIGKVELTILRLAIFEMLYDEEIPTGVAINEAVELAKKFGEDNSSAFVNGILAKLAD
ncbi:MAG: transcription antitermination protein NusB [Clostridiales bacterium]|nr:transcription antitermination protein NusB [Clostridiales bacterium]